MFASLLTDPNAFMLSKKERMDAIKKKCENLINDTKTIWSKLHDMPDVFAYKFEVSTSKYLEGCYIIYLELNPLRTTKRRAPQMINNLNEEFDDNAFNFKKVNPMEVILTVPYRSSIMTFIINRSPLTTYHSLICQDVEAGLPQKLTTTSLSFCVKFLMHLDDPSFRIGYNSPGALASVNHLHLHLLYIRQNLYVDNAELQSLRSPHVYRLSSSMPTEGICFLFNISDDSNLIESKLNELMSFVIWLIDNQMPHNLFITVGRNSNSDAKPLKVFIFARENFVIVKDVNDFNIGFCELAGFVPIGNHELFSSLTEPDVFERIRKESGNVYERVYQYFEKKAKRNPPINDLETE